MPRKRRHPGVGRVVGERAEALLSAVRASVEATPDRWGSRPSEVGPDHYGYCFGGVVVVRVSALSGLRLDREEYPVGRPRAWGRSTARAVDVPGTVAIPKPAPVVPHCTVGLDGPLLPDELRREVVWDRVCRRIVDYARAHRDTICSIPSQARPYHIACLHRGRLAVPVRRFADLTGIQGKDVWAELPYCAVQSVEPVTWGSGRIVCVLLTLGPRVDRPGDEGLRL